MEQQMQTLPEELQMVILNYIGINKCRDSQNHELICRRDGYKFSKEYQVLQVARKYALAIHRTTMIENFNKMKMKKIISVFKRIWFERIWIDYEFGFKFNSRVNFIKSIENEYDNSQCEDLELLLLIASSR